MTRGTELVILLAVLALVFGGVFESPLLIALGGGLCRWGWIKADRDELVRVFG